MLEDCLGQKYRRRYWSPRLNKGVWVVKTKILCIHRYINIHLPEALSVCCCCPTALILLNISATLSACCSAAVLVLLGVCSAIVVLDVWKTGLASSDVWIQVNEQANKSNSSTVMTVLIGCYWKPNPACPHLTLHDKLLLCY